MTTYRNDMFETPNADDVTKLERLSRVIDIFRDIDGSISANYLQAFILVALKPGRGSTEYARDLGLAQAVVSRILLEIGKKSRMGGEGLGLVDSVHDPKDLRLKRNYLTPKGRELLRKILNAQGHT